jgi:hypothetical protein
LSDIDSRAEIDRTDQATTDMLESLEFERDYWRTSTTPTERRARRRWFGEYFDLGERPAKPPRNRKQPKRC